MNVYPVMSVQAGQAVVDTSFWSLCCRSGLDQYLWQVWGTPIWVPTVVEQQIFYHPSGNFIDQVLFRQAKQGGQLAIRDPQQRIGVFKSGECEVLSLGVELRATVLIDDFSPHQYAVHTLGLDAVAVTELLVSLLAAGVLDIPGAEVAYRKLAQLRATNQVWLRWARTEIQKRGGNP